MYTSPSRALKQRSVPLAKGSVCPNRFSFLQQQWHVSGHSGCDLSAHKVVCACECEQVVQHSTMLEWWTSRHASCS